MLTLIQLQPGILIALPCQSFNKCDLSTYYCKDKTLTEAEASADLHPVTSGMTLFATCPELPIMRVIPGVAVDAAPTQGGNRTAFGCRFGVAGLALDLEMEPCQWVCGLLVMIEAPGLPVSNAVARLALAALPSFVGIILDVAAHTLALDLLELLGLVTGRTRHVAMSTCQGKTRFAVVKGSDFPVLVTMALLALLAL